MCVTIKRACFRWCGMIQYSAVVNSVFFNNKCNTFFGLNLTLVYTFPMCMTWRFHFPIRNYDFKERRKRGNLLDTHNIMHGLGRIPEYTFFTRGDTLRRGNSLKII